MDEDRNSLAYWFPRIEAAGLRVPRTEIATTDADLSYLLDGKEPKGWASFMAEMEGAGARIGYPAFLRTGHGSGKHAWRRTCYVPFADELADHVVALVEWSHVVDMIGLPTSVWAVRELIPTVPLFRCEGYGGFPVTREFRMFVRDDYVAHTQPYWPPDAVEEGRPDDPDWRAKLMEASMLTDYEWYQLEGWAMRACEAVGGGYWSVDLMQDATGAWWLTDMADGDCSYRWEPGSQLRPLLP